MADPQLRRARAADYDSIVAAVDPGWDAQSVAPSVTTTARAGTW